jgi:cytochrome c oxidase cbb3-type subunit 1
MFFVSGIIIMAYNVVMTIRQSRIEKAAIEAKIAAKLAKA